MDLRMWWEGVFWSTMQAHVHVRTYARFPIALFWHVSSGRSRSRCCKPVGRACICEAHAALLRVHPELWMTLQIRQLEPYKLLCLLFVVRHFPRVHDKVPWDLPAGNRVPLSNLTSDRSSSSVWTDLILDLSGRVGVGWFRLSATKNVMTWWIARPFCAHGAQLHIELNRPTPLIWQICERITQEGSTQQH